jgi:ADP-heptose:LPS heptosyltransferase
MGWKERLRGLALDVLAQRDDRCYWRQPHTGMPLKPGAHLCLWQPDGKLGDAVMLTGFVQGLLQQRPDVRLSLVCAPALVAYWQGIPGVAAAIAHHPSAQATVRMLTGKMGPVDVLVSLESFLSLDTVGFLRKLRPQVAAGFSVAPYRLFDIAMSDLTYAFPRRHISERFTLMAQLMGLPEPLPATLRADLADLAHEHSTARVRLPAHPQRVFVNAMGAASHRSFTRASVQRLLDAVQAACPGAPVLLSVAPEAREAWATQLAGQTQVALCPPLMSTWELIALVACCPVVITPDTALGHIGAATGARVAVFFADSHYNPVVWCPQAAQRMLVLPHTEGDVNHFTDADAQAVARTLLHPDQHPAEQAA